MPPQYIFIEPDKIKAERQKRIERSRISEVDIIIIFEKNNKSKSDRIKPD